MRATAARRVGGALLLAVAAATAVGLAPRTAHAQWALEGNLLWPVVPGVGIYNVKAARGLGAPPTGGVARSELLVGLFARPGVDRDDEGRFSEFGLTAGARRNLGERLHVELLLHPTFARLERSVVTGLDYDGFALATELYVGWRVKRDAWYLLPQAGVVATPVQPDWPRPDGSSVFPALSLIVGRTFGGGR